MRYILNKLGLLVAFSLAVSCKGGGDQYTFELLDAEKTGIDFSNDLTPNKDLNIFNYMYFYNGGGIGAGDFNNDGLVDLYFTASMKENRLYLNKGGMKFEDVTAQSFPNVKGNSWSNGVSVVDINQDGMLDIYVSEVSGVETLQGHNRLWICTKIQANGVPVYEEQSQNYGLDLVGLGTQAVFFDYDLDGDLDFFQLNHSVHQNGTYGFRESYKGTFHPLAGDRLFRNDSETASTTTAFKPHFVEVTKDAGILSDALGYGLGVGVSDINLDGYPDMYVGNDFHENDYLYINQQNGTFKEQLQESMMHTSRFSMGVEVADLNNDIFPEVMSLDMLPEDKEILKRSEGEDSYDVYKYKLSYGYNYQFARNNLQLNRGWTNDKAKDVTFSEIALFSGVSATDWSWSPLFMDFDNDGRKDLFIANGIPKRMNDLDYINFVSTDEMQQHIQQKAFDKLEASLTDKLPEIKIPNKFFVNHPDLKFTDAAASILNNKDSYSNGAVYADLDNDGDLDVVTNNINDKAFVYENKAETYSSDNAYVRVYLKGAAQNRNAIGAKLLVFKKEGETVSYQKFPVKAFQASMEVPMVVGLGNPASIDSVALIWPDNTFQKLNITKQDSLTLTYRKGLPTFDYTWLSQKQTLVPMTDITSQVKLDLLHEEDKFVEFESNSLIHTRISAEGPALAVADINQDGLQDVFVGSSKTSLAHVYLQTKAGQFTELAEPSLKQDFDYEEVAAQWVDVNGDIFLDLVVAEGGNESKAKSGLRVYVNDGTGKLSLKEKVFPQIGITISCIKLLDFNKDGKLDLFVGGRTSPYFYGNIPRSYLLQNTGSGRFADVTEKQGKELANIGMVKNAEVVDLDKDGDQDLVLALEWDGVVEFENQQGLLVEKVLTTEKGWWNFVLPLDVDNDGDLDLMVGNAGQNTRLQATHEEPIRMYVKDFDNNGALDNILTYYVNHTEILFSSKFDFQKQFPYTKKKFLLAKDFAKASIEDIVGASELGNAKVFEANFFDNAILINDGKGNFTVKSLPSKAQYTPYMAAQVVDANGDKLPDVLLGGNFYDCNIQLGRYDADYGTLLINKGKGNFEVKSLNGLQIKGQVKAFAKIKIHNKEAIIVARNNDKLMVIAGK